MKTKFIQGLLSLALGAGPLSAQSLETRDLTPAEALSDFRTLVNAVEGLYGPLEFKERTLGLDSMARIQRAEEALQKGRTDDDYFAVYKQYLAGFQDGHISLSLTPISERIQRYLIPIFITPAGDRFLVGAVGAVLADQGIRVGDELVSIDGRSPESLLPLIRQYESFANPISDRHLVYYSLLRPSYMRELVPTQPKARLVFARADGSRYERQLFWRVEIEGQDAPTYVPRTPAQAKAEIPAKQTMNLLAKGSLLAWGSPTSFFASSANARKFFIQSVTPNPEFLRKYGVEPLLAPMIQSWIFTWREQKFLLVRIPDYAPANFFEIETYVNTYKAILDQFQGQVQGLVLDQTHNPGGYVAYVTELARLFTPRSVEGMVQAMNADRVWIESYRSFARFIDPRLESEYARELYYISTQIESAYDSFEPLSVPVQFEGPEPYLEPSDFVWRKPLLVLIDELSGSGGDAFPLLLKNNRLARFFGERTMGLGGSVEPTVTLPNMQATLYLTRGLFTTYREDGQYSDASYIENTGVEPDLRYVLTVDDLRGGYVNYMTAFAEVIWNMSNPGN